MTMNMFFFGFLLLLFGVCIAEPLHPKHSGVRPTLRPLHLQASGDFLDMLRRRVITSVLGAMQPQEEVLFHILGLTVNPRSLKP